MLSSINTDNILNFVVSIRINYIATIINNCSGITTSNTWNIATVLPLLLMIQCIYVLFLGKVTACLFDKTGTITTDELVAAGAVAPPKGTPLLFAC
jgi:magnesium-transporting ATPase (P-type)